MTAPRAPGEHPPLVRHFAAAAPGYAAAAERPPWAWLRAREAAAVMTAIGPVAGLPVLELGCGAGHYTRRLLAAGAARLTAVDLVPEMLAELPTTNVEPVLADIAALDLSRTFPVILAAGVIEFLDRPAALFATARRHAEPSARLVVLAPLNGLTGRLYRASHARHGVRIALFTPAELAALAEAEGWRPAGLVRTGLFAGVLALGLPA